MHRDEFLERFASPEPLHRPLSSSEGEVAVLSPIVDVAPLAVVTPIETDLLHRSTVGAQLVGDDFFGSTIPFDEPLQ